MGATVEDIRQRKARQGLFFMSLALGATVIVLIMLVSILGLMVVRGSKRLFFSPVYSFVLADGTTATTAIEESVEIDVPEAGRLETTSPLQAHKRYLNLQIQLLKYSYAPLGPDVRVDVFKDEIRKIKDPFANEGEEAVMITQTVQVKQPSIQNAKAVRLDAASRTWLVQLEDGKETTFGPEYQLIFSTKGSDPVNLTTFVTRYLQNNPEEAARREKEIASNLELLSKSDALVIEAGATGYVIRYVEKKDEKGVIYHQIERVRKLPPILSFTIIEKWNWFQFFWAFPRSSNTEGGVFPCIFGTVLMTLLMTVIVAPFGIATAVYLREYAKDNWFTRLIRLSVANLAGVPSIVFGLFGFGFFVLTVGGGIDNMFFDGDKVFGTPCVLWASLTMALLTLPVMIVATEEALRTVPPELREGAMALGATKFSTITTVVIPTAMPGILTGIILAVARGAGEVAPLLLTGVIAQKDQLPLDIFGREKFMNLAYHVYDLSVKSPPNKIEEAQSLAFSSALVLVMVIVTMNLAAILLRARLSQIRAA